MSRHVLDSSALLAALFSEEGAEVVAERGQAAILSAVNYSEVLAKAIEKGAARADAELLLSSLSLQIVPFDQEQASVTASLREPTRRLGLSLGDRACLALASLRKLPVLTADRDWAGVDVGVVVEVIR